MEKTLISNIALTLLTIIVVGVVLECGRIGIILTTFTSKKILALSIVVTDALQSYLIILFSITMILIPFNFIDDKYSIHNILLLLLSSSFLLSLVIYYLIIRLNIPQKLIDFDQQDNFLKIFVISFKNEVNYALNDVKGNYIEKNTEFLVVLVTIFAIINSTISTRIPDPTISYSIESLLTSFDMQLLLVMLSLYIQYAHQKIPWLQRSSTYIEKKV